jgi:hypothetical protein
MDTTNSFPSGSIRVSDADRDQAIAELSQHFPGDLHRMSHLPTARLIILGVFTVIIAGNVLGGIAGHVRFGWLIPVVVLGSVFVRLARR